MNQQSSPRITWLTVCLFAIAMAWVESAVVFYLRTHIDRIIPYQAYPLPIVGGFGRIEFTRELATLLMLLTVGMLAGKTWRFRWGYVALAFGVWDIFYYVFLRVMCGWPRSLFDWDILFLIPLPWWGPVLSPVLIATVMILWGTLVTQLERVHPPVLPTGRVWALASLGAVWALYVFMADSLRVASQGLETLRHLLPADFNWPFFLIALALMSAPLAWELWWLRPTRETAIASARAD